MSQQCYKQNRPQQLRGFYYVALTGSFSAAAERLSLGQPAVTLQVQALERELGVSLFKRSHGEVRLTQEGEELFKLAATVVESIESLDEAFHEKLESLEAGTVTVAGEYSVITEMLPAIAVDYHSKYPTVELKLRYGSSSEVLRLVRQRDADIGIASDVDLGIVADLTSEIGSATGRVCFRPLTRCDLQVVVPRDHPLASLSTVSLDNVVQYPLVAPLNDTLLWKFVSEAMRRQGMSPRVCVRVSGSGARLRYVQAGLGITFATPKWFPDVAPQDLVWIPIADASFARSFGLLTRTDVSASLWVQRFVDQVMSSVPRMSLAN